MTADDEKRLIAYLDAQYAKMKGERNRRAIDGHKYTAAILIADITEERVRLGEILAPDWFMRAYIEGFRVVEQIAERAK